MNGFLISVLQRMNRSNKKYKNIFETIKKKAKKTYYSVKLLNFTKDSKKHGML